MPIVRNYDKNFFKNWSHDMAYILGFIYADGNIVKTKRGTHFVAIYTADQELLRSVKMIIKSDHVISERSSNSGKVFRLQIGSKEWFFDLSKIGVFPNKSSRMRLPDLPDKYFGDFVRGYFDGDGNVWTGEIHKNRLNPSITIQVAFTSCSYEFLFDLHRGLENMANVKGGSLYKSKTKNFSRLSFSKMDALKIYKIMYNAGHKLFLPRKKQVFAKFVNCGGSSTG